MLITDAYREQNRQLHAANPRYGTTGGQVAVLVRPVADWGRKPILDYGAGRETMKAALGPAYKVTGYDPAVSGLDGAPVPHPVVVCTEVLEHVEPECIDAVLDDLRRVTLERGMFTISLAPAKKHLPDGRNTHLIIETKDWWFAKLKAHGFTITDHGDGVDKDGKVLGLWANVE